MKTETQNSYFNFACSCKFVFSKWKTLPANVKTMKQTKPNTIHCTMFAVCVYSFRGLYFFLFICTQSYENDSPKWLNFIYTKRIRTSGKRANKQARNKCCHIYIYFIYVCSVVYGYKSILALYFDLMHEPAA